MLVGVPNTSSVVTHSLLIAALGDWYRNELILIFCWGSRSKETLNTYPGAYSLQVVTRIWSRSLWFRLPHGMNRIWLRLCSQCLHPLRSHVRPEPPKVTLSKGRTFGRWLNHNYDGTFVDEISGVVRQKKQICHLVASSARCKRILGRSLGLTRPP